VSFIESGAKRRSEVLLTASELTRYIQVHFAKRKGTTVLPFPIRATGFAVLQARVVRGENNIRG